MMDAITAAHDGDIQMIDSTSVRAQQQAATEKLGIEIIVSVVPEISPRALSCSPIRPTTPIASAR
jgi:hypothetical protein